jgi:hypothetical protein
MDQLSQKDLQLHMSILGWILIGTHAIGLVIGGFVFFLLTGIGAAVGDSVAFGVLSVTGTAVGLLIALLALPGVLAGYGLLTRKSWGRLLALVVSVLGLFNFPVGTIIGVYALWVLLQQEAPYYFATE